MNSSSNYQKHTTKNPLKRKMIDNFNSRLIELIKSLKKETPFTILDVGCGEGFVANLLAAAFPKTTITGIDFSFDALVIAKKNDTIHYVRGDIYTLPIPSNAFDIVLCSEVLEHLTTPENALLELQRVSKRWVICTVPNEPWFSLGNFLALKNITRLGNPPDHINHYSIGQFSDFVTSVTRQKVNSFSTFPWSVVFFSKTTNQ